MYYRPKDGHGLAHNPFNAIVTPRPIAWISTRAQDGSENLAPYSFFNAVAYTPPQVMFASTSAKADQDGTKDTVANIRDSGVFCINIVEYEMRVAMNESSGAWAREVDEFDKAGVARADCSEIACSRVAAAPASLECELAEIVKLRGEANFLVVGEVVGVHLRDDCIKDGIFDILTYQPLTRLGYRDYSKISESFTLKRPGE